MRCATVASETRYARAISFVVSPPSSRSEDEAQEVVVEWVVELGRYLEALDVVAVDLALVSQLLGFSLMDLGAAEAIDRPVLGRDQEPRARVVRDP